LAASRATSYAIPRFRATAPKCPVWVGKIGHEITDPGKVRCLAEIVAYSKEKLCGGLDIAAETVNPTPTPDCQRKAGDGDQPIPAAGPLTRAFQRSGRSVVAGIGSR
jgi:hypothetical protein